LLELIFSDEVSIIIKLLWISLKTGGINIMLQIDIEEKDKVAVISLSGDLSLHSIEGFEKTFKKYPGSGFDVIGLDLKNLPYIDSFGISRILKISRILLADGKDFVLVDMNDNIHQIFKMSTFDRLFKIMTGEEFEMEYLSNEIPVRSYNADHVDEYTVSHDSLNNPKIKQVEFVDTNGTTLILLEE